MLRQDGVGSTRDTQSKRLSKVDHIVMLMMENGSFDHMLGYDTAGAGGTDPTKARRRGRGHSLAALAVGASA